MSENILVFIGARGGSKGLKDKNIKPLMGKPLIAHTILTALKWGKAARVIVSTDSLKIANVAKHYGAQVPFLRPAKMATDKAPKGPALRHALVECEKIFNERYTVVVDLQVTSPVRRIKDLDQCLDLYKKYKPSTLFSVVETHNNPYFNLVELDKNKNVKRSKYLPNHIYRRQDAPKVYAVNGSIYFYSRKHLLASENPSVFSRNQRIYVMDETAEIDIDRAIDFKILEVLLKTKFIKIESL